MATLVYASPATITISPASLATSATFIAGRESNEVNNTSNVYQDAMVQGTVGTTPTANTLILVYVWGSDVSLATTARDVFDGADSAETTTVGARDSFMKVGAACIVDATTSDKAYAFGPFSVADLFGGNMPQFWGLFVAHNTAVNLNATGGNHVMQYTGVKY
jgi:hypothetical protein